MKALDAKHFLLEVRLDRAKVPSFDAYPFSLPGVAKLRKLTLHPAVTFLVGENGTGKSTLLEAFAVAWGFNPEGGSRNFHFSSRASHSVLHKYLTLSRGVHQPRDGFFLRAESFFNVATEIERLDAEPGGPPIIDSYGGVSLHEQSHGESFFSLLLHRFRGQGLYLLDEPEAALSPSRQMAMLARLHALVSEGSQFVIATHSPIVMAYPHATIYLLTEAGLRAVAYTETEHYLVAKQFLGNHEKMLRILLLLEDQGPPSRDSRRVR